VATQFTDPISWPFLPVPENGTLCFPDLASSVRDAIRILLVTRPGEQLMAPLFGAGIERFLHEGNTLALRARIRSLILATLQQCETRIVVDRVDVEPVPNAPDRVAVTISYRLVRTSAAQQVGVTMSLG